MFILYILIALLVLILIRAARISSASLIEKHIEISRPPSEVFNYVKLLRNHELFNKWTMTDPALKISYTGTDGTLGFSSHWKSEIKNVGEGHQTISGITNNSRIDYTIKFIKPFPGESTAYLITTEVQLDGVVGTRVTWGFASQRNFMAKILQTLINLERMLGKDLETSLLNLKKNLSH